jgi:hypothetical protein
MFRRTRSSGGACLLCDERRVAREKSGESAGDAEGHFVNRVYCFYVALKIAHLRERVGGVGHSDIQKEEEGCTL